MANEAEIRRWNDDRWTAAWPKRETLTGAVTPYLRAAITPAPGQRVLDIGCGGGGLVIALAEDVAPDGAVVGVDVSAELLRLAAQRADQAGVTNVDFVELDMQLGSPGADPFDLAVSQFGVMFFDEPTKAFGNVATHLRAGALLAFACWQTVDRNPWHVATALGDLVRAKPPPLPGKSVAGPFSLGDAERTEGILRDAGFRHIAIEPHQVSIVAPPSAVIDAADTLELLGVPPENLPEAREAVDRHLRRFHLEGDTYEFPLAFHIVTARTA